MFKKLFRFVKSSTTQRNLLFTNAVLCLCYPLCYVLLILLPFGDEALSRKLYGVGVVAINILFLLILTLNINTIRIVYEEISSPRKKHITLVYSFTISIWMLYVVTAYLYCFFQPGFISYFHHHVRMDFHTSASLMNIISLVFSVGLAILFREYYIQAKLRDMLVFIIPAIFYFAFKTLMPFNLFIISWVVFSGCQFLLYYSIVDAVWNSNGSLANHSSQKIHFFKRGFRSNI